MRALRVVGLGEDASAVILEDPARHECFSVPVDERLRAAARGEVSRLGQIEVEGESQVRPREIQARIRAGESVEQVATSAGVPFQRIERFAYPVLLERSRMAELAQRAHPVQADGPDVRTLAEVVTNSFGLRGADYGEAEWDAWRGDDGKWVVALRWQAGRSENSAHWAYHPGAHGGTVTVLDEPARDLVEGLPGKPLRTVRPVTALAQQAVEAPSRRPDEPPAEPVEPTPEPAARNQNARNQNGREPDAPETEPTAPEAGDRAGSTGARKNHPTVPSWEDVLLGVRKPG